MSNIENKYVAFCDILGFSNSVISEFEEIAERYNQFKEEVKGHGFLSLKISIYSDSIMIVGNDLIEVCQVVQILLWTTLRYDWIVRGGIGFGKHWKESDDNNLYVVSEALVKAVTIEKTIKHPIIAISDEINLGLEYWIHGFTNTVFDLPIIHYDNMNIVNPFNNYWFASAEIKLTKKKNEHVEHASKYEYLLKLIEDIKACKEFVPKSIIDDLLEKKLIEKTD